MKPLWIEHATSDVSFRRANIVILPLEFGWQERERHELGRNVSNQSDFENANETLPRSSISSIIVWILSTPNGANLESQMIQRRTVKKDFCIFSMDEVSRNQNVVVSLPKSHTSFGNSDKKFMPCAILSGLQNVFNESSLFTRSLHFYRPIPRATLKNHGLGQNLER